MGNVVGNKLLSDGAFEIIADNARVGICVGDKLAAV